MSASTTCVGSLLHARYAPSCVQLDRRATIIETIVGETGWKINLHADRLDRVNTEWRGNPEEAERSKRMLHDVYEELRDEYREHWQDLQR